MRGKPNETWFPECRGKAGDRSQTSAMFQKCITFHGRGTLAPVDGNIDSKKYTEMASCCKTLSRKAIYIPE